MSGLTPILHRLIQTRGPLTLAEYMAECLFHPEFGYYATRDPFGTKGDFITAPEISQMFGELIGLCLAQAWINQGSPARFVLAELGPGRGTLMADALRATRAVPGFHAAAEVHLVEASPHLKSVQSQTLAGFAPHWHDRIDSLPEAPLFLIANEFFDALPIRQYIRNGDLWEERHIGLRDGVLAFGKAAATRVPSLDHRLADTRDGDLVEDCPTATAISQAIGARLAQNGGTALLIDYGDWRSLGDTFQALHGHEPVNPLEKPGECDLTAHVDFELIARAAPCRHTRLTPQGVFLERLGIAPRAQALASHLAGDALDQHIAAHRRLTHPSEMGTLFKVLGLYPEGSAPPPGLDP
ncbi:class I SAM-dependent methyltransferase [Rhodalgimonas zhirmunskyi]|uniref:SAM-dependent methyltransferase n=1 Tax=Rhodalgimonas zhirmunskyi TaxID=2964767 RepID=A0AAJ1U7M2_9RHOB|nr:SAM-dependent methyltransferase [Rhodoalgimonas zhirmunskyi]MDQ2094906.1 SAM-dependent methyltransferase [Rhodoalgimonas zhirmunskyi]